MNVGLGDDLLFFFFSIVTPVCKAKYVLVPEQNVKFSFLFQRAGTSDWCVVTSREAGSQGWMPPRGRLAFGVGCRLSAAREEGAVGRCGRTAHIPHLCC